jgi:AraC-like DNA-binding protein
VVTGRVPDLDGLEFATASFVTQSFPRHFHETYSISVVERGMGAIWCDGANYEVPPNGLTLVNPGQVHTGGVASGADSMYYRVLYPSPELVGQFMHEDRRPIVSEFRRPSVVDAAIAPLLSRAHGLLGIPLRSIERDDAMLALLLALFGRHGRSRALDSRRQLVESAGIRQVLEYLHANIAGPITLGAVAALVGWSPAYLSRAFRRHVGMRPSEYVLQLRVTVGRQLLCAGATPVRAALEAGFADQSHFTNVFRHWTGMTPAAFRATCSVSPGQSDARRSALRAATVRA